MKENLSKEDILDFLRKNKVFFKEEFYVDNIILFGSYARDEATSESDVDILIESDVKNFDKQYRLKVFLEKNLGKKVDLSYLEAIRPFMMRFIKEELIYA